VKILEENQVIWQYLREGKVIAYPTEAVYGLGCDAFQQQAVEAILRLKKRSVSQGLIVLIHDWTQLIPLIGEVPDAALDNVKQTWPGPVTWVFPKSTIIPDWLSGKHHSIAIRMSAHPVASKLCEFGPIVSTSANISGQKPAIDLMDLRLQFPHGIDAVVTGVLGGEKQPTAVYDVLTGVRLR
jgi:L-threonylcarbamoyladenylate synthase